MTKDIKVEDCHLMYGDCLERMKEIPGGSVDLILTDPPYGTTQCKWDSVIPLEPMWEQLKRIIKPNGAIALFGQGLFSSKLSISNEKMFRYTHIWEKTKAGGFLNAKRRPLQAHEDVLVFYKKQCNYIPQFALGTPYRKTARTNGDDNNYGKFERVGVTAVNSGTRYPRSVVKYSNDNHHSLHPTQKPIALMEYLIKTYTNESETVLDFTFGSCTTGVACINTNRKFIGIELDENYFNIGVNRIKERCND